MDGIKGIDPRVLFPKDPTRTASSAQPANGSSEKQVVEQGASAEALAEFKKSLGPNTAVSFVYDKEIDRVIVQVIDDDSKNVIKQFPPDELLEFFRKFSQVVGTFINKRA
jgi:flagellar protein FlaG